MRETVGARQGAEELSKQLGEVYSSLIAEFAKYGGSGLGFAGDAMMCWFDRENAEGERDKSSASQQRQAWGSPDSWPKLSEAQEENEWLLPNWWYYCNPKFDELFQQAANELDQT
ncbi:MAG TPA: hypothetical protein VN843_29110 [Anaerolineales bacterium]|nr:hypothetical protein [Anaerolineales bacterium]